MLTKVSTTYTISKQKAGKGKTEREAENGKEKAGGKGTVEKPGIGKFYGKSQSDFNIDYFIIKEQTFFLGT